MAEELTLKYRAFLSYSHRDAAWGKWLHAAVEGYRVDKDLVGRSSPYGPIPKSLRPIFRDREDFSAGHSLTQQTLAALEASQFLIVLCSPNAARSAYVNEEVRRFKAMGRADKVIPVIVGGEPGHPEHECFPPAVRFAVGSDGTLTDVHEEPIAADARSEGDGKEIAKQKVLAGLLGVGLDEIVRREQRTRQRRNRFWASLAGVFLLLAVIASSSAVFAYKKLVESEDRLDQAIELAYGFVSEATAMSDRAGVPIELNLSLLRRAEAALNHLTAQGADAQKLRHRRALMLLSFADTFRRLGRIDDWRTRATEARALLVSIAANPASDLALQRDLASAHDAVGDASLAKGFSEEAIASYRASLPIRERIAAYDATNLHWRRELWLTCDRLSDVLWEMDRKAASVQVSRTTFARLVQLMKAAPKGGHSQSDIGDRIRLANAILGLQRNAFRAAGPTIMVRNGYRHGFAMLADSGDRGHESYALGIELVGDSYRLNFRRARFETNPPGDSLAKALEAYAESLSARRKLIEMDGSNGLWQRNLARLYDKVGAVHVELNRLDLAREEFRKSLAVRQRFSSIDPSNVMWLLEYMESHWRLASTSDEPEFRWQLIVDTLTKLAGIGGLSPLQAKLQHAAEAELAVRRAPESASAYSARGLSLLARADPYRAISDFSKAIELQPSKAAHYTNLGHAYKAKVDHDFANADFESQFDDHDRAIAAYTKAIELDADDSAAFHGRGTAYLKRASSMWRDEHHDRAVSDYTRALEITPNNAATYLGRAAAHFDNHDTAIDDFTQALAIDPKNPSAYRGRAATLLKKGNYDLAIADYTKVIEFDQLNEWVYRTRAEAHLGNGDHDRAIADYTTVIELDPTDAGPYNGRAWAYFKIGRPHLGLPDVERSLELQPADPNALDTRGHIFEALGRREEAIADFRSALAKNPNIAESQDALKRLGVNP